MPLVVEVGKIVVNKCLDRGLFINTQKLEKLLCLMQVEGIRLSGRPLFKENIHSWPCGVAIKEVDKEFLLYSQKFTESLQEYIALLISQEEAVNYVLNQYGHLDAYDLNQLPDNQKVLKLCVPTEGSDTPFVCWQILVGAFRNIED